MGSSYSRGGAHRGERVRVDGDEQGRVKMERR
jgi:hypothetical protein